MDVAKSKEYEGSLKPDINQIKLLSIKKQNKNIYNEEIIKIGKKLDEMKTIEELVLAYSEIKTIPNYNKDINFDKIILDLVDKIMDNIKKINELLSEETNQKVKNIIEK